MKHPLTNLQRTAREITLSAAEKQQMRARILNAMDKTMASASAHAARPVKSPYGWFMPKFATPLAALLIVMLGGGTAYAAQGALPGDMLYTVKVSVNEPVREVLAVSTEAKASFHTDIAEERLREAETLASEGRLDATISGEIEVEFEKHVALAEEFTQSVAEEDPGVAAQLSAQFSSISAHGEILARLSDDEQDDSSRERTLAFADRVRARSARDTSTRSGAVMAMKTIALAEPVEPAAAKVQTFAVMATESDVASDTATTTRVIVAATTSATAKEIRTTKRLQEKALSTIEDAQDSFDAIKGSLDAAMTTKIEEEVHLLSLYMEEGDTALEEGMYADAQASYTAALRHANELSTLFKASKKFNKSVLKSLLGNVGEVKGIEIDREHEEKSKREHE